jgi:hypothetical protein
LYCLARFENDDYRRESIKKEDVHNIYKVTLSICTNTYWFLNEREDDRIANCTHC